MVNVIELFLAFGKTDTGHFDTNSYQNTRKTERYQNTTVKIHRGELAKSNLQNA